MLVTSGRSSAELTYDEFSRLSSLQRKHDSANVVGYEYDYWTSGDKTSTQLDTLTIKKGANSNTYKVLDYTYDANGNITSITDGNYVTTYYYDDLNQLVRVDDPREGTIWTYSYDLGGNILNKSEYVYNLNGPTEDDLYESRNYSYNTSGWGDVLVGITSNIINKTITSDAIGNMLSDGTWNYTWQHGRQLASMTNGSTTVSFGYDASGMRTSKTIGNKTWEYVYNGSTLSYMTDGTNELFFSYDSMGSMSVKYNGTEYYYVLNAQGDVIALVNSSGTTVVTYSYDAWGDLLSTGGSMASTLGQINPLRYRGYVYDTETGLYYLQTRYYNPEMCRFICADGLVSTGQGILGHNMFAYCGNNPVNRNDPSGAFWNKIKNGLQKAWNSVKKAVKKIFGAGVTAKVSHKTEQKTYISGSSPITVTQGIKNTVTVTEIGNSSKPIYMYSEVEASFSDYEAEISTGLRATFGDGYLDISMSSLFNSGISVSGTLFGSQYTGSINTNNITGMIEAELETAYSWDENGNITESVYINVSTNYWTYIWAGVAVAAAVGGPAVAGAVAGGLASLGGIGGLIPAI